MMKRNRLLYLLLLAASLVFVYFYGGKMPYMIFNTILILPAVSFLYVVLVFFRFKYRQDIDKRFVTKGEKVSFVFSVSNEDPILYPYIRVNFYGTGTIFASQFKSQYFSLLPFQKKSYSFDFQCRYRGSYEIGVKSIEIEDFLGIFKLVYKVFDPRNITVAPRIVPIDSFRLKTDYISESHPVLNHSQEDMATMLDTRQYIYGDNLKRIHWKLSAKFNELMVKRFQNTCETSSTLILDLKKGSLSPEENAVIDDKVIEAAVSIIYYCLHKWIPVNLVFYSDGIVELKGKNPLGFDEMYKALSRVSFDQNIDFKDIIDIYTGNTLIKNNILILTSNVDYELYNQIYKTNIAGYNLSLVYVSPEELTGVKDYAADNILSYLPELGAITYKVNINDDTKYVLEN
jgi:uncharacterized protein (DUF58 family)